MYIAFCSRFNLPCSLVDAFSFYSLVNCLFYFLLGGVLFFLWIVILVKSLWRKRIGLNWSKYVHGTLCTINMDGIMSHGFSYWPESKSVYPWS